ncbi:MAG: tRNA pseudouridine(13) synthase TruD [Candidatus Bathyarchaeia archaeon]|nr:tRNA pseudouridine(13) synthase TruD [Candidatus Bathyarchaeota archaeon]
MLKVSSIEENAGIEVYATECRGVGGSIKRVPEDFIVEEILVDGSKASVKLDENVANNLAGHGRYLICVLIKRGVDTILAIEEIADKLGVSPDRIGFAGIKDTNALTAQYISIGGIPANKISLVNVEGLLIKPLGYSNEEMSPKKLFGNRFTITVRGITLKEKTIRRRIEKIMSEIKDFGGIPNFFGHQRFGTIRPITHIVGKYIIKGDFEGAALTFLTYVSPFEGPKAREARRELAETMDFKRALKRFPETLMYERLVLEHLAKSPRDYIGAFHKLPANLRRLFIQSYQSYLFNRFLSERIKRDIPLEEAQTGDYVVRLSSLGLPTRKFIRVKDSNISSVNEEIKAGRAAVALPLIGPKQPPSEGLQGEIEREILERENVSGEDFKRASIIKVNLFGGLRVALERVMDLRARVISEEGAAENSVKFEFTLHKGTYATIVLREFMKPRNDRELIESGF